MKKTTVRALLALLCAVTLLVSVAAPVYAKMGTSDMPWLKEGSLLDQILERDGFIDGIWYPWLNDGKTGHNLSGNEVMAMYYAQSEENAKEWSRVELDYVGADEVYRQIYNLKAMGYNMMAWGGSIFAEGVKLDLYTGEVLGIKEDYLANARRLLDICREVGMPVVWNVYFHSSSMPHYYGKEGWDIVTRMAADNKVADQYAEKFVRPLCKMLAEYKDVVAMVSIADEPENEANDVLVGDHFTGDRAMYGVNRDDLFYLLKAINNVVKAELPNVARTVASNNKNKAMYADFALDLMGHNNYSNQANMPLTEDYKTSRPVILAEYNVGGDGKESDDELTAMLIKFRERMMEYGYKGGLQWCWLPTATKSNTSYYLLNSKNPTDFRATVTDLRHYIDEYRAKYQGKTITVDAAVLYANDGTGLVEWIPSKRGVKMDLLRSNDGGKTWTKVLDNVDQSAYVGQTKKGSYKDSKTANSQYKIIVRDAKGNAAESTPNNVAGVEDKYIKEMTTILPDKIGIAYVKSTLKQDQAKLLSFGVENNRPLSASANLIQNSSFESNSGQWTSLLGGQVSVVSDKTAPDGSKSLYFNSTGAKSGNFNTKFTVKVEKNTDYVFSTWVKGAYLSSSNSGNASVGVIDPDTGKFMVYWEYYRSYARSSREDQQIYPTAWDDEWHLRSVSFNSGNKTEVTIALYGYGSQMWLDDMALFKNGEGTKYMSDNSKGNLRVNYYADEYTCADNKCANGNPAVSGTDYWSSGYGWDAGFMSVTGGGKSGKALQYSSNSGAGLYYIKWVDVTPNTEYVFSLDVKIQKTGNGRIGLLTDRMLIPEDAVFLSFEDDHYDGQWFDYYITFNSSTFTRVGIAVCDLGGQVLFDNIQIFKTADGKLVSENDGHNTAGGQTGGNADSGNTDGDTSAPDSGNTDGDTSAPDGDNTDGSTADKDTDKDTGKNKDKNAGSNKGSFTLSGPMILLVSFGGTAVLIGVGVGIYFLVRTIVRKSKAKAAAAAETPDTPDTPAE